MNFNSPEYLLFLPVVVLAYLAIRRWERLRDLFLLVASYYFYMSWNWKYAGLLLFSTVIDYLAGLGMARWQSPAARRLLLVLSLVTNLGLLALFKYFVFFLDVTQHWILLDTVDLSRWSLNLLLPVGISFYTFQTLSYTIDVYRREIPAERSLVKFALFVSFFPQLVAGPIVRASDFLPQLHGMPTLRRDDFGQGLFLILRGLFKKIVFADLLAALAVDDIFRDPGAFSSVELLLGLYGYAFQIYNDFSGYSDIAIGSARLMGFQLSENFNRPYLAESLREFWTRWHISLSTWIRDYLYIPLGGSRLGSRRTVVNLLITMLLAGLWHGAAINFVCWGAYHGAALIVGRQAWVARLTPRSAWARRAICFHLVCIGWLLFRIGDFASLQEYVRGLAGGTFGLRIDPLYGVILSSAALVHWAPRELVDAAMERASRLNPAAQGAIAAALLLMYCGCSVGAPAFIYFQF